MRATKSLDQAAAYVGIGRTKFGELARRGEIPSIKVGARRLFLITALDRWLEAQSKGAMTAGDVDGAA
jgi:excisionase family DNA binding protein